MESGTCTVICRQGIPNCTDDFITSYGCQAHKDQVGNVTALTCPVSCSLMASSCDSLGEVVNLGPNGHYYDHALPLAIYSKDGHGFLGYLTYDNSFVAPDCDNNDGCFCPQKCSGRCEHKGNRPAPQPALECGTGCLRRIGQKLFKLTTSLQGPNGVSVNQAWNGQSQMPEMILINNTAVHLGTHSTHPDHLGGVFFSRFLGGNSRVNVTSLQNVFHRYSIQNSANFLSCPFRPWSRFQSVPNKHDTDNVTCFHEQLPRNSNEYNKCHPDNSQWIFLPIDVTKALRPMRRDDLFRIAKYPLHPNGQNFLQWDCDEGNFNLTGWDEASVFSIPSSPPDHPETQNCQFLPGHFSGYSSPSNPASQVASVKYQQQPIPAPAAPQPQQMVAAPPPPPPAPAPAAPTQSGLRRAMPWIVAGVIGALVLGAAVAMSSRARTNRDRANLSGNVPATPAASE